MDKIVSLLGLLTMMLLAWLISENRRKMDLRLIVSGVGLQFVLGAFILWTIPGQIGFGWARDFITRVIDFSNAGAMFLFGEELVQGTGAILALKMLPPIIFFSSLMAVLFHLGVIQWVIRGIARVMVWVMDASGSESLCAGANVFVGMTTAPLVVRPYLNTMTRSELMAMMTSGMATIAGGMMAVYAGLGADPGHLLTASLMSAPASLVIAKIIIPETEDSPTMGKVKVDIPRQDANVLDAACRGASEGLKLALNVAAMLIAFIALIHLVNWAISPIVVDGQPLTLQRTLGWVFAPVAWVIGVPWKDAQAIGMLLGEKTVFNEFIAYKDLDGMRKALSPRSVTIATYALCGFANFGSVAIMIGGIGSLIPKRRSDLAKLGLRSLVGGTLAALMTAAVAGMLV